MNPIANRAVLNMPVIKQLVYKDWYLNRKLLAVYVGGGILSLSIISLGEWQFFMGAIMFITMLVALGNHQLSVTMINERKEQTLAFVMSLPVSPADYAMAKFLSNMVLFFVPWSLLTLVTTLVILLAPLPDGLIAFTLLICVLIAVNHCICWSVTMATETEGSFLMVMIGLNCLLNPALYFLARSPDIGRHNLDPNFIWTGTSTLVLVCEILAIVLLLVGTLYFRSRKKVFF
jgi:ABC-2 type transport system permease protein